MPLSWNEIRDRATAFQSRWSKAASEQAESQSFWAEFLNIYGVDRKKVAVYEKQVQMKRGKSIRNGRIDLFWPGTVLVEMKSAGQDLDRAFAQAADYFDALPARDLPRYILVSDFQRFRLFDLQENIDHPEFRLDQLAQRAKLFGFIAGYQAQTIKPQDPINEKAALRMGALHDALKASGFVGHPLEVLLVRLLFCLFADDTGIFQPAQSFREWLEGETKPDGSDLGGALAVLFGVLDTAESARQTSQKESFKSFPHVNGALFSETHRAPAFDSKMRELLLECCALDWSKISPAIFGALFQSVMSNADRRKLGAHYTSEENILKLIKPLFLDELRTEFEKIKNNANKLKEFHQRLRTLTFFDPACGCGNFLVIAYRELRLLELDILRAVNDGPGSRYLDVHTQIAVNVDQFYGIEIEEFPAQIAQVALWLTDHQMNRAVSEEFGMYFARIPLKQSPHIKHGNALRIDWNEVLPAERCSYVLGNPPFRGAMVMDDEQRRDMRRVFHDLKGFGILDFVSCWFWLASKYIDESTRGCAFVSTNSICQGEQVGILWSQLFQRQRVVISYAHQTFRWSNGGQGVAAVHCVIVGISKRDCVSPRLFEYLDVAGEPHEIFASRISPYLFDAPSVFLINRDLPISRVPTMRFGSMARDGGNLILTSVERDELIRSCPFSSKWIREYVGSQELLNGDSRYCLWLVGASPTELRACTQVMSRIEDTRKFRLESKAAATRRFAETPSLFCQIAQPGGAYLMVPRVSSEKRRFVPMGFFSSEIIGNDASLLVPDAQLTHFGTLSSTMHNAWVRTTCGRLESRFRYSKDIVYNNFPWPDAVTAKSPSDKDQKIIAMIEAAAQAVLDARAAHPSASLADLYDPLTMPPDLVKAHQKLDAAVDAAYFHSHAVDGAKKSWKSDAERVAFLFTLYQEFTSILPIAAGAKAKSATRKKSAPKSTKA